MENKYLCSICGIDIFRKLMINKVFICNCDNEYTLQKTETGFMVNNITSGDIKFINKDVRQ
jgi:hypothetical protein